MPPSISAGWEVSAQQAGLPYGPHCVPVTKVAVAAEVVLFIIITRFEVSYALNRPLKT